MEIDVTFKKWSVNIMWVLHMIWPIYTLLYMVPMIPISYICLLVYSRSPRKAMKLLTMAMKWIYSILLYKGTYKFFRHYIERRTKVYYKDFYKYVEETI